MRYSSIGNMNSAKIILGTDGYGEAVSEAEAFALLDFYFECGGNHIDTANIYCGGESERIVGKWLKSKKRDSVIIATKGGHPKLDAPDIARLSLRELEHDADISLKRLGTDCIDLFWLHRDGKRTDVGEIIEGLNALVKSGKIRNFGCSNWRSERIAAADSYAARHGLKSFCASQIRFSAASTAPSYDGDPTLVEMDAHEFEFYKNAKIPVMAFASQAKGFFSKYSELGESGLSAKARERYYCDENVAKCRTVSSLADKYSLSAAAIACAALTSIEPVDTFPIIGGKSLGQIAQSLGGSDIVLPADEVRRLVNFA